MHRLRERKSPACERARKNAKKRGIKEQGRRRSIPSTALPAPEIKIGSRLPVNYSMPRNRTGICEPVHKVLKKILGEVAPSIPAVLAGLRALDLDHAGPCAARALARRRCCGLGGRRAGKGLPQAVDRFGQGRDLLRQTAWCRTAARPAGGVPSTTGPAPPAAGRWIPAGSLPGPWSSRPVARRLARCAPAARARRPRGRVREHVRYRCATMRSR